EAGAVGGDEPLAGQFAGAVEAGLRREGAGLGGGEDLRLAVDRARRREGDAADACGTHRFDHIEGSYSILLEVAGGVPGAEADVGVGGGVEAEVVPGEGGLKGAAVEEVAVDEGEAGVPAGVVEEGLLPGGEVVVGGDVVAGGQEAVDEVAADEPGAAGDE